MLSKKLFIGLFIFICCSSHSWAEYAEIRRVSRFGSCVGGERVTTFDGRQYLPGLRNMKFQCNGNIPSQCKFLCGTTCSSLKDLRGGPQSENPWATTSVSIDAGALARCEAQDKAEKAQRKLMADNKAMTADCGKRHLLIGKEKGKNYCLSKCDGRNGANVLKGTGKGMKCITPAQAEAENARSNARSGAGNSKSGTKTSGSSSKGSGNSDQPKMCSASNGMPSGIITGDQTTQDPCVNEAIQKNTSCYPTYTASCVESFKRDQIKKWADDNGFDLNRFLDCTGQSKDSNYLSKFFQLKFDGDDSADMTEGNAQKDGDKFSTQLNKQCLRVVTNPQLAQWGSAMKLAMNKISVPAKDEKGKIVDQQESGRRFRVS